MSDLITPRTKRKIRKIFSPLIRIGLKKEFSILSNNCWGGISYDKFGEKYTSPTIGLLFKPSDYIKFLSNLPLYLSLHPILIPQRQRRENNYQGMYAASLGDITIFFIHYSSGEEAIRKWEKRKSRIIWNNIIAKFSDLTVDKEIITQDLITQFSKLPYKKIFFTTNQEWSKEFSSFSIYLPKHDSKGNAINELHQAFKIYKISKLKALINL
jgi:uncharacterized protein (DUF1919 family)